MKKSIGPELIVIFAGVILTVAVLVASVFISPRFDNRLEDVSSNSFSGVSFPIGEKGKTDLNSASLEELMQLYGIGESRAQAIINYRIDNGGFLTIDELLFIDGITEKIVNKNIDKITIGRYSEENYEVQSD